ncbi:MAG: sigma-70 family RNA polymerase sigma factor [Sphingobium sp.]|nr:sigma-70 family RNA polymerase sigma factor [Sphingobium sp.]MBP6112887.1 sigma-70 family RNA polymerase sigma factor [Sphingobium sp.]MBP9156829.1 sigma-70 family RNA polymerase sigma factor [Sphingobium sp.]MCC6480888.1 sigma-70 family RNA polymerase sigma factor [Sphingomonadaceae bacterium]
MKPEREVAAEPVDDAVFDAQFKEQLVGIIGPLRAFARGLCAQRTLADDLVQEAMMRAWSARRSYTHGTNFRAWIFMILRNQYYTTLRKNARVVAWDPEAAERILVTPATQHVGIEVADVVQALQKINPEQREVLLLVGANGLSYEEASEIMGCAVGTIKSRLARGRAALSALIEGAEPEPHITGKPGHPPPYKL